MANKPAGNATGPLGMEPATFLQFGKDRSENMLEMQKELLHAYEEASQAWVARVKTEVELWSNLAAKLADSHSLPEGMDAYRDCVSQRMRMAVDDGKRLFEDGQKIVGAMTRSLSNGFPKNGKKKAV
jgi:hypothetical protein